MALPKVIVEVNVLTEKLNDFNVDWIVVVTKTIPRFLM